MRRCRFLALLLALILLLLPSCHNSDDEIIILPVAELSEAVGELLANSDKLTAVDDDYVRGMLDLDVSLLDEYVLMVQTSGTQIDQYGIFRSPDSEKTAEVKRAVEGYITKLRVNWDAFQYFPEERHKIKAAEVRSAGGYVFYTILSEEESSAVFKRLEGMLRPDK